ncbi:MAG TPA: cation:proton antiporter [Longimicrobiales bacterium]|nr:cation:proton antiporter [Longimicrobiales bacterium]
MTAIALLLAAAAAAHVMARWLGLPTIPLLMLAGAAVVVVAPVPAEFLEDALILGLTFLLFVTGVELSPTRVAGQRRVALRVGALQFVVMAAAGFAASLALGFGVHEAAYLALALTASSTLVVIRLLQRRGQLFEPVGRMVLGVLLLQDILVIALIPLVVFLPMGVAPAARALFGVLVLIALAWATLRWVSPLLLRLHDDEEVMLLGVIGLLFVFLGVARMLGLPLVVGAFLAGVGLSAFPVNGIVREQLDSIGDFFSAIFFTALGAVLVRPSPAELLQAAALVLLVVIVTPILVTAVAERAGFSARPGVEAGLLLSQTSELSLVVGLQGLVFGQISTGVFTVIVLVTVTTMMLTPFITGDRVVWWLLRIHPMRGTSPPTAPPRGHVLLLGTGETGMPLLETLVTAGQDVFVVDDDPALIRRMQEADIPCLRGDASDAEVLLRAGADHAAVVLSTIRRPEDNRTLLRVARGRPVLVRVFEPSDAEWISELGGRPILYSEAAADEFLHWYRTEFMHGP